MGSLEIVLVRHGRSALERVPGRINATQLRAWIDAYHEHGIADDSVPAAALIQEGERAGMIVCSDLRRAVESAQRIAPGRIAQESPLLREAGWPPRGDWGGIRLPLIVWGTLSFLLRRSGWSSGETWGQAQGRAGEAVERLAELAATHKRVLVVAHGNLNMLMARELRRRGWNGGRWPASRNWGYTRYWRGS
jgi:broad specificity phosphatase PhoE